MSVNSSIYRKYFDNERHLRTITLCSALEFGKILLLRPKVASLNPPTRGNQILRAFVCLTANEVGVFRTLGGSNPLVSALTALELLDP